MYIFLFHQTAVHHAALNRDSQSLQVLLNQGGDLHQFDADQKTPCDYVKGNMHCEQMIEQHLGVCKVCMCPVMYSESPNSGTIWFESC